MTDDARGLIRCEEALRRLASYLDGDLGPDERTDVERHLDACRSCYSRAEFERRLHAQLARLGQRELEPEFRARLQDLVRQFTTGPDAAPRDG
jgi:anti-sigma factor (TIGR02949 family)